MFCFSFIWLSASHRVVCFSRPTRADVCAFSQGFFETAGDAQQAPPAIVKEAAAFDAFLQRRFNWSAVAPNILEDSEWGPTVVDSRLDHTANEFASAASQHAAGAAVEKVGGDADHEARVAAAFGGLELGATEQLAAAARQSRAMRMAALDSEERQGRRQTESGGVDSVCGTVTSLGERSEIATPSSVSGQHVGFEDAYLLRGTLILMC